MRLSDFKCMIRDMQEYENYSLNYALEGINVAKTP